ncbi:uncharacterized protein LOC134463487 [Engraulis encrasicolus]|uniref:uncharacterized protein LOC134463487 n=1 Tax=Engraulis encrasicolus TaxID=184585 RepID=UPI002FD45DBF
MSVSENVLHTSEFSLDSIYNNRSALQSYFLNVFPIFILEIPAVKPQLKISPAVIRESGSVQMSCEVPQSQSAFLCLFYLHGVEAASYNRPSCQISLSGMQLLRWARQTSPLEAEVGCYYLTASLEERIKSNHSDPVAVTVLNRLQTPDITVSEHISISIFIFCGIPKHYGQASSCRLYTGDEPQYYLTSDTSRRESGDLFCKFALNKDILFKRLQSLRSREVSCDYTVDSQPPSVSPRSDPFKFTGKISHYTC